MQRDELAVDGARLGEVSRQGGGAHFSHRFRCHVGRDRDDAVGAHGHERQRGIVVAAVDGKALGQAGQQRRSPADVTRGVLQPDDVGVVGQPQHGGIGDIGHGAAGHVVQDDGQTAFLGHRGEVAVQALLRGLVVIGGHLQRGVHPHLEGVASELDGLARGIGTGTGDDRDTAAAMLGGDPDELSMLLDADGGRFSGGAHRHDGAGPGLDVPVEQVAICVEIQ